MEEGGGARRRLSLFEQMSAVDRTRDLAGLTLEDVIGAKKPPPPVAAANPPAAQAPPPPVNRTLLDIIRDEEPNGGSLFGHKDKKSWKAFRDKLRLKRAGAAWTSTVPIPASDVPIHNYSNGNSNNLNNQARSMMTRRSSVRFSAIPTANAGDSTNGDDSDDQPAVPSSRPQMTRRSSSRFGLSSNAPPDNSSVNATAVGDEPPARSFRPQMSRGTSTRHTGIPAIESEEESIPEGTRQPSVALAEERSLSAREAVAAQEASEAEAAAQAAAEAAAEQHSPEDPSSAGGGAEAEPVRMSLMDLLEETDRQMGVVGSRYTMADVVGCDEEEEEDEGMDGGDGIEHTCCVCMVRHKGAAFIPCGHTFCRLCSRELWVQRGNCPLCNGYILEILDIF